MELSCAFFSACKDSTQKSAKIPRDLFKILALFQQFLIKLMPCHLRTMLCFLSGLSVSCLANMSCLLAKGLTCKWALNTASQSWSATEEVWLSPQITVVFLGSTPGDITQQIRPDVTLIDAIEI